MPQLYALFPPLEENCKLSAGHFDNAAIESFFGTLKAEYYHLAKLDDIDALEAGVHEYIRYYNNERIKLGLQDLSPVAYRVKNAA